MSNIRKPGLFLSFIVGALLFTTLDMFHVLGGVLVYKRPLLGITAWWVPIQFGFAGIIITLSAPWLDEIAKALGKKQIKSVSPWFDLAAFVIAYAISATAMLLGHGKISAILYLTLLLRYGFSSLGLWLSGDIVFVIAAFVLGPAAEMLVLLTKEFHYVRPDALVIPSWLPALWGHGAFFTRRVLAHTRVRTS